MQDHPEQGYQVLARKYRPETFADLVGQEAMVRTLKNAFAADRIAHAIDEQIGMRAFDVVVAGDEVSEAKPHPEPYLRAAELLGVDIRDCVAVEDSLPGITSAVASGATSLAVPFHVVLPDSPHYTLREEGLAGFTLADLQAMHSDVMAR